MTSTEIIITTFAFGWILYALVITLRAKEYKRLTVAFILFIYMVLIAFTPYFDFLSWKIKILIQLFLWMFFFMIGVFEKEK
ncbi:hypothetical protein ACEOWG_000410 [Bacillus cereus]